MVRKAFLLVLNAVAAVGDIDGDAVVAVGGAFCGGWRGCCPGVVGLEMLLLSWLEMLVFDTCGGTVVEKNEKDLNQAKILSMFVNQKNIQNEWVFTINTLFVRIFKC
jgi:hypothetical protein